VSAPIIDPAIDTAVVALMRQVGADIILPRYRRLAADEVMEKSPGDVVTVVDRESEAILTEGLAALLPSARVVGEEAVAADPALLDRLDDGTVWLVDPLDGTRNFSEGHGPFAVMIGLIDAGEAVAAWILDPVTGRLCQALRDGGAFIDGVRIAARTSTAPLPIAAIATYFLPPDRREDIATRSAGKLNVVPIPMCAGEQYPRLVLGTNDIALFERTLPWDHVPGALFVEEAGGRVARPDGTPYRAASTASGLIGAATPELWDKAAEVLFQ